MASYLSYDVLVFLSWFQLRLGYIGLLVSIQFDKKLILRPTSSYFLCKFYLVLYRLIKFSKKYTKNFQEKAIYLLCIKKILKIVKFGITIKRKSLTPDWG